MLPTSLARQIARSATITSCSTATVPTAQAFAASRCGYRVTHQRRHSSSKTSVPPNGSPPRTRSAPHQNATSRSRGRKTKAVVLESGFEHLPSVPTTHHIRPNEINISSFFSLHRPISVTTVIPRTTTPASFASIFEPRASSPSKAATTKKDDLAERMIACEEEMEAILQDSEPMQAYFQEGPEEAAAPFADTNRTYARASVPEDPKTKSKMLEFPHLLPFAPPPVPEAGMLTPQARPRVKRRTRRPKIWTTTIVVTEFTNRSGEKKWAAARTPMSRVRHDEAVAIPSVFIEEPDRGLVAAIEEEDVPHRAPQPTGGIAEEEVVTERQPFLRRMQSRHEVWREHMMERMEAISTKRQRKLKMKKHKYKKLMRRTRNVRRRLGKL